MKKNDLVFAAIVLAIFLPFVISPQALSFYETATREHGIAMSFLKFALLATLGESLGLRIKEGVYNKTGFGLAPRAVVWGFLGITIFLAFKIFANGAPVFVNYLLNGATLPKVVNAFAISLTMNSIFAPWMMTLHKITDTHIITHGGKISALLKPIPFAKILKELNWDVQFNFVFLKTIPLFWIPAHTITFMLPQEYQVLFAAILGIALGVILSIAAIKGGRGSETGPA